MKRIRSKIKRASITIVIIYIMINGFVWGLMKAYINSYNAINSEKLVMAQLTDKSGGKEVKILENRFFLPDKLDKDSNIYFAVRSIMPSRIRAVSEIFQRIGREAVQISLKQSQHNHDNY